MYNYILAWGTIIVFMIMLTIIIIKLSDINDNLTIIDFTTDKIYKYLFMIFMADRIICKKDYDIDLQKFCEEYCRKVTDNDINESELEESVSQYLEESVMDEDSIDDFLNN